LKVSDENSRIRVSGSESTPKCHGSATLQKSLPSIVVIICIAVWQVDMVELEEGGMFDEDTMPDWMRSMRGVAPANRLQPPPLMAPAPAPFPEPIQQIPPGTGMLSCLE
jgi:hypothetical protein